MLGDRLCRGFLFFLDLERTGANVKKDQGRICAQCVTG